jgi:phosphatidylinositol glycan class O
MLGLTDDELSIIAGLKSQSQSKGCWLDRRVDSLAILVVDALRFDFAQHELPLSVGARLQNAKHQNGTSSATTSSQLLQFVADPPTVTMQRLKGLTTGGLPTFADISGNFGGAAIDEDSWIQQIQTTPFFKRGLQHPSRLGFVGDDTWVDLFPTQFAESYPLPSFNTRDLDTVDNGCLERLPLLLQDLRTTGKSPQELEVIVAHFLGVDHVGHTFGPHNQHMHDKLAQIDVALSTTLDILDDEEESCHLALIFGDHGMTEDGNHGGGTEDEINAALFVHFSPACGYMPLDLTPQTGSKYIQEAFQSIHQIDLVPTISILLGLPIPYANIGGIAPSLLGLDGIQETAAALALNAAQVWRYFTVYSSTANKLPDLPELEERLQEAIRVYKQALAHPKAGDDSNLYYKACGLFKIFLLEASELGHRVWTRFDTVGMTLAGVIILVALILCLASLYMGAASLYLPQAQYLEVAISGVFIIFQSGMLSFSNSYIEAEQAICMFMLAVLGILLFIRMSDPGNPGNARILPSLALILPVLSRIGETMVSGHGLDPSIPLYPAHHSVVFLSSLAALIAMRIQIYRKLATQVKNGLFHAATDCIVIFFLALSWMEKRNPDVTRNGYFWARAVIAIWILCTPETIYEALRPRPPVPQSEKNAASPPRESMMLARSLAAVSKLLLAIMTVTGPSTAASVVLVSTQAWILYILGGASGPYQVRLWICYFSASSFLFL